MTESTVGAMRADLTDEEALRQGLLGPVQMSVLLGVPMDELLAKFREQAGDTPAGVRFTFQLPRAWIRSSKARTALSRTDDMGEALQILPVYDDREARWVDRDGAVWSVMGEDEVGVPLLSTHGSAVSGPQSGITVNQLVTRHGPIRKAARSGGH